jgi:hypothetical protein
VLLPQGAISADVGHQQISGVGSRLHEVLDWSA